MSQENVELARRSYDAVNRRDLDALLALMDEEVEAVSRIVAVEGGLHGHAGIRRWWDSWFGAFPTTTSRWSSTRDRQDCVFAAFRALRPRRWQPPALRGHGLAREPLAAREMHLVARLRNLDEALEAAGLSE